MSDSSRDLGSAARQPGEDSPWRLVACAVCAVQALAAVAWAVVEVVRAVGGGTGDVGIAFALAGLLVAFAAALALLALGWRRGGGWPKTPTVVWNLLLLPVAWSLVQAGTLLLGLSVGAVALVALGAAVATPTTFGPDAQD